MAGSAPQDKQLTRGNKMSFKVLNQLEQIDQQLEKLSNHDLLMIANILINSDAGTLAEVLTGVAALPKSLQGMVIDSIHAKVKAR